MQVTVHQFDFFAAVVWYKRCAASLAWYLVSCFIASSNPVLSSICSELYLNPNLRLRFSCKEVFLLSLKLGMWVYQAIVTREDKNREGTYVGLTDTGFKTRYNAHISSFRNTSNNNATTLREYMFTLRGTIKWDSTSNGDWYQELKPIPNNKEIQYMFKKKNRSQFPTPCSNHE